MPTRTELQAAGLLIAEYLKEQTGADDGVGLVPGYRLVPLPMTHQDRIALTIPLATAARRAKNGERLAKISAIIRQQLTASPAITNTELADVLNSEGLRTYKGQLWSEHTVAALKRHAIDEPSAP